MIDDCGCDVWVPALGGSESFEIAGVRVEDVGALRGAGVRGVGCGEEDGGPEDGVGGGLDVPDCGGGPDLRLGVSIDAMVFGGVVCEGG